MAVKHNVFLSLANKIANQFISLPCVKAIALGGSHTAGALDTHSDIDLYIYSHEIIPLSTRQGIVNKLGASKTDLNLTYWDLGDEWIDRDTDIEVDVIYWDPVWIQGQLDRTLVAHQANLGYSTCFWRTVVTSSILFDRQNWLTGLQKKCNQPYPEPLKKAIIEKNYPVLRSVIPSYYQQIKKAVERQDLISVNHRLAAFLASYFDVLFAANEVLHPGEKRMLSRVLDECSKVPENLQQQIDDILYSAAGGDGRLLRQLDDLVDSLDAILADQVLDQETT